MSTRYEADGNVLFLRTSTLVDIPVSTVLEGASNAGLESAIVCGYRSDGTEYFASTTCDAPSIAWIMDRFKFKLLKDSED